ncbi:FAD-binding oxidoreductase [Actinoplanes regularis]|uniref:FAD-binding oxidoreductase n=1 Tax=Actinoplanes regularis TaxID=52697 RepID=UPI0024A23B1D|nr:FAD-binding oxidoreductase [Actinoplanes regularis]GLW30927.1 4-cresol dehydrogenase [Actinoplanes regularis]
MTSAVLGPNSGGYRSRRVTGLIRPKTVDEVQAILRDRAGQPEKPPIHAFSTGRNWGLGSREPARDDVLALDLSGLDQVRDLDLAAGWAVIEPGVTQGRLAELTAGTDRMVNVTVSTAHSSVLGNAVERGVGLRHQRVDDLVGLEVVLPDGELIRVGWWPDRDRPTAVYPYGRGPSLLQLFVQSNLGVVTGAVIRLLPRPEQLRVVRLLFDADRFADAARLFRRWVSQGLTSGVPKVFSPVAARGYGVDGRFLAHLPVDGAAAKVAALTGILLTEARDSGLFTEVGVGGEDPATALTERAYLGDPDVTDTVFQAKMGQAAEDIDAHVGFLFFLPMVPFTAEALARAVHLLDQVTATTGLPCGGTAHLLGPDHVDFVVALRFPRTDDDFARAHQALDLLYESFTAAGFLPYRLDVDHHEWIDRCGGDPAARRFVRLLKELIDPTGVIAPGRYH